MRKVIGVVTQIDRENGNPERAENWLRLTGVSRVFRVSSVTGEGIEALLDYLYDREETCRNLRCGAAEECPLSEYKHTQSEQEETN